MPATLPVGFAVCLPRVDTIFRADENVDIDVEARCLCPYPEPFALTEMVVPRPLSR